MALVLIPCVVLGNDLVQRDRISTYNDTGRFPKVIEVTEFLAGVVTKDDRIVAQVPDNQPLTYYLGDNIESCSVSGSKVFDDTAATSLVDVLPNLQTLSCGATSLSDDGLTSLLSLKSLSATENNLSEQAVKQLNSVLPDCKVKS